ncbi:hypothetical protein TWF696_003734 [Orbilia brochopaga]|uniref:Uncharacterized protein n=1 Tax=Orbilia brochopaga TaxID=3140254 RepID=A0AAV9V409_9PEZI
MTLASWFRGEASQQESGGEGYPQSEEEAKNHIAEIQERLNKLKLNKEILDVDRLLMLLGEGQYSNSSHVFFELIQNAEDNSYGRRTPEIKIHHENGYVLFESNEIGFSKANVDSICTACKSSKVLSDIKQDDLIGEKGIGFKSVFRIASRVWISSGYYSFRFDKDEPLGRVYPIWDSLPSHIERKKGYTAILMKVLDNIQPSEIAGSLQAIDPTILLFLNKIKKLELNSITNEPTPVTFWTSNRREEGGRWKDLLMADMIPSEPHVLSSILTRNETESIAYYAFRYPVSGLPDHSLRPKSADIILLFPRSIESIQFATAYSYLPIREYGFKFTIQSNFILVANRKEIDDNEWNKSIVEKLPRALLEAVSQFGKLESDLQYGWPLLLPIGRLKGSIFEDLPENVRLEFSSGAILEDTNGNMRLPKQLTYIPRAYRDPDGKPLIPPAHSSKHSLSEKYPLKTIEALNILGVQNLSDSEFLKDLKYFIQRAPSVFQQMPDAWHNQVCKLLLKLVEYFRQDLRGLHLIPLRHGSWISAETNNLRPFFPESPKSPIFPMGVDRMAEIHPTIATTSERGRLFIALGAEILSAKMLAFQILYEHKFLPDKIRTLLMPPRNAVAHLVFLFHSGRGITEDYIGSLQCLTSTEEVALLSEVYISSEEQFSACSFAQSSNAGSETLGNLKFLHPEYLEAFGADTTSPGYKWLLDTLRVRTLLRVAKPTRGGTYELHQDFLSISSSSPIEILTTLRYHWNFYAAWFVEPAAKQYGKDEQDAPLNLGKTSRQKLRDMVSSIVVTCHGGAKVKLKEAYLPLEHLMELSHLASCRPCNTKAHACSICARIETVRKKEGLQASHGVIPSDRFLDIPDVEDGGWNFLEVFGVGVEPDLELFLSRLRQIHGQNTSHLHVSRIYSQLGRHLPIDQQETIREFFDEGAFVYIPDDYGSSTGTWHNFSECVWHTPVSLKHIPSLSNYYTAQFKLFCRVLSPREVDLKLLKVEASRLDPADGIKHVSSVLQSISLSIDNKRTEVMAAAEGLEGCYMFPVTAAGEAHREYFSAFPSDFTSFELRTGNKKDEWFISDSFDLQKAFEGRVRLSSLSTSFFEINISTLALVMGLESRLLSRAATQDPIHATSQRLDESLTKRLREKAFYISSLIVHNDKTAAIKWLRRAKVIQCEEIRVSWTLATAKKRVKSSVSKVKSVCFLDDSDSIAIYFVPGEIDDTYMPVHLAHQLARICSIYRSENETFLYQILTQNNYGRLRDNLQARLGTTIFKSMEEEFDKIQRELDLIAELESGDWEASGSNREKASETGAINMEDEIFQKQDETAYVAEPGTNKSEVVVRERASTSDSGYDESETIDEGTSLVKYRNERKENASGEWGSAPVGNINEEEDRKNTDSENMDSEQKAVDDSRKPYPRGSIIKSSNPRIIPRRDRHEDLRRTNRTSSQMEFRNMDSGVIFQSEPMTFLGEDTQDTRYFGELQVRTPG